MHVVTVLLRVSVPKSVNKNKTKRASDVCTQSSFSKTFETRNIDKYAIV